MVDSKDEEIKKGVEAILFASGRVVSIKELKELLGLSRPERIRRAVNSLKEDYDSRDSSMMIVEEGDGWKLTIREAVLPLVHTINPHTELSKSILETLAIIAWKQPIVQSDIIKVRTNKAYDHISELEKLGFISKQRYGRSYSIKVTQKFMDYFDLPDDQAVKGLFKGFKDVETAVQKKADEFDKQISEEDKKMIESRTEEELEAITDQETEEELGLKTFDDELDPVDFPDSEPHMKVYTDGSSGQGAQEETSKVRPNSNASEPGAENQEPTVAKGKEESDDNNSQESDEEKAKRIAEELLAEEESKDIEEATEERKLHPELEEFIAGEKKPETPKRPEEKEKQPSETQDVAEDAGTSTDQDTADQEPTIAEGKVDSPDDDTQKPDSEDSKDSEPKSAEEFPGQFDGDENESKDTDNTEPSK